ncbi:AMMECR1 domain-containing protein [bacterium DOLJORAL78_65_58]|nr:MAG: AMMECR1 domain-containing protein [bacterium DOLZORAL124_64_63]PIE75519.1 MAG: AMMECR1 domain-containing protein [bacterium DOLJORAL78_65_58]
MNTLTPRQKDFLRLVAATAVKAAAQGEPAPPVADLAATAGVPLEGALARKAGAFVTLRRDGRLRGCIGYIEGIKSLAAAVADNGRSAAVGDPRFSPVTPDEVDRIQIEISALTPLREAHGPEEIEVGTHGILLEKEGRAAVFLPQVATEQGWDRDTTLDQLALKAGLRPGDWRQGARFRIFEAEVF